ncbi:hypothetical protein QS306_15775 [Paraburkholderia bonniea]|uniref:hypothetical protein n=1 Tax=Paraburkholderia bonniea TaxID=2152891 RepID=UPI001290C4EF|nr:hypothetical protein [Paraburkholderia bonniea]WJF91547.1 hypothetical protein QS306_15775 [Paraburkholderia bonniea]WJF94866.1 hypothetical protein QS308_15780 [Paraburkholderia bonniea]
MLLYAVAPLSVYLAAAGWISPAWRTVAALTWVFTSSIIEEAQVGCRWRRYPSRMACLFYRVFFCLGVLAAPGCLSEGANNAAGVVARDPG